MNRFSKVVGRLVVVGALILSAFVVATQPASASYAQCSYGWSCMWDAPNGSGDPVIFTYSSYSGKGCVNLAIRPVTGYNSAKGNYGSHANFAIYSGANCTGWIATLHDGMNWSSEFQTVNSISVG